MPRWDSGSENSASFAATHRSHASARTTPPPLARPWTRATVIARMDVIAFMARRPRLTLAASPPSPDTGPGPLRSKPLQNDRPELATDDDTDVGTSVEPGGGGDQLFEGPVVECVAAVGTGEAQGPDGVRRRQLDALEAGIHAPQGTAACRRGPKRRRFREPQGLDIRIRGVAAVPPTASRPIDRRWMTSSSIVGSAPARKPRSGTSTSGTAAQCSLLRCRCRRSRAGGRCGAASVRQGVACFSHVRSRARAPTLARHHHATRRNRRVPAGTDRPPDTPGADRRNRHPGCVRTDVGGVRGPVGPRPASAGRNAR